ncbi:hypothetical protein ACSSUR_24265 [Pseudomonas cedrina]|uniref:hypothetical protein n=1 Tax=Pseudomonas cedrina TaxID=651740 RepID=UPI003EDA9F15
MLVIVDRDGLLTVISDEVEDIYEYAETIGGKVIDDSEYVAPPYVPSPQELATIEAKWRESEMPTAQQNVTAIEYGEEDIPGTAQQWQKYWLALRKWTDTNPDFPDSSKRPVAPS